MSFIKRIGSNFKIITLFMVLAVVIVYSTSTTFAWFTDLEDDLGEGTSGLINISIVDENDLSLTTAFKTITYNLQDPYTTPETVLKPIYVRSMPDTNIEVLIRVMFYVSWSDGVVEEVDYSLAAGWLQDQAYEVGDYIYLSSVLAYSTSGISIAFLNSIDLANYPNYDGQDLTISIYAEAMQPSESGFNLWADDAPTGWDPLNLL